MAYAARVMRGLIIDDLRGRLTQKRGGGIQHTTLDFDAQSIRDPQVLERISDALDELATHNPLLAEIVDLTFFCGFSTAEVAASAVSPNVASKRCWERARIYPPRTGGCHP